VSRRGREWAAAFDARRGQRRGDAGTPEWVREWLAEGVLRCRWCGSERAAVYVQLEGGPHTLRHSFATHFLQTRPDVYLLARVLGHSDVAVTRLYSHLLPDHLERARNAVSFAPSVGPSALTAARRWGVKP